MTGRRGWPLLTATTVVVSVTGLTACTSDEQKRVDTASDFVQTYAKAWSKGDTEGIAALMDGGGPQVGQFRRDLAVQRSRVKPLGAPTCTEKSCRQKIRYTHAIPGAGDWSYTTEIELRGSPRLRVHWSPTVLHPKATSKTRFRMQRKLPKRASILDRDSKPITEDRPVVRLFLVPGSVEDKTYAALRQHLGLSPDGLRKKVRGAPRPDGTVQIITLREALWANVAGHLRGLPGLEVVEGTMSLADSPRFARAILGSVGLPDSEKTVANAGSAYVRTDEMGLSGLQRVLQRTLAGRPGGHIELYEPSTGDITERLVSFKAAAGKPVRTTLSTDVQQAAEDAVEDATKPTSLVALRASTGEILATANGPGVVEYNRAFVGQYPPGSTFKVLSSAALLERGLVVQDKVACPATVNVGGKTFRNANHSKLPAGPFWKAFAHSCNTAVVSRAKDVSNNDLRKMAERFGIGASWKAEQIGLPAYAGSMPEPRDLTDRAATMIGQGRVQMSPLGMATVAAAVASGRPRTPYLIASRPGRDVGERLPDGLRTSLRGLMRAVVTDGSGRILKGLPGVHAKTGTAEYSEGKGLRTHAWMIGFRDDLAFAVVVEDGGVGGKNAGPVVKRFLERTQRVAPS